MQKGPQMKALIKIVLVIFLALPAVSFTQESTAKGVYRLSGNIGLSYRSYKLAEVDLDESHFKFDFSPGYSVFILNNLELGVNLAYTFNYYHVSKIIPGYARGGYNQSLAIAPGVRYYFPTEKVIPFIGSGVSFGSDMSLNLIKYLHLVSFSVHGGFDFFLSKNIAVEPSVTYNHYISNYYSDGINEIQLGAGINYFIF